MYAIQVEKMTCGGCANRVTKAILSLDEEAKVNVNLKQKLIHVTSGSDATAVVQAILAAGYPAELTN